MIRRFVRWWRSYFGCWSDCPVCKQQTMKLHLENPIHPEGPPLLYHWQCHNPECGVISDTKPTPLMDDAARKHGYSDFTEFAEKLAGKKLEYPDDVG